MRPTWWTEEEDALLRLVSDKTTPQRIDTVLGRGTSGLAAKNRMRRLGLPARKKSTQPMSETAVRIIYTRLKEGTPFNLEQLSLIADTSSRQNERNKVVWTKGDDAHLLYHLGRKSLSLIAIDLGRDVIALRDRLRHLGKRDELRRYTKQGLRKALEARGCRLAAKGVHEWIAKGMVRAWKDLGAWVIHRDDWEDRVANHVWGEKFRQYPGMSDDEYAEYVAKRPKDKEPYHIRRRRLDRHRRERKEQSIWI